MRELLPRRKCMKTVWLLRMLREAQAAGYHKLVIRVRKGGYYETRQPRAHGDVEALFPVNTPYNKAPGKDDFMSRPAIWEIVRDVGLEMGCGNGGTGVHQAQFTAYDGLGERLENNKAYTFVLRESTSKLGEPIFIGNPRYG